MKTVGRPREFDEKEILDRGIDFFRNNGYGGASMSELLGHLNLSRQSLYNAFGSKRGFFHACVKRYRREWGDRLFGAAKKSEVSVEDLSAVLRDLTEFLGRERDANCLLVRSTMELGSPEAVVVGEMQQHTEVLERIARRALENQATAHGVRDRSRFEREVSLTVAVVFGLHVMAKSRVSAKKMNAAVDALIDRLGSDTWNTRQTPHNG